MSNQPKRTNVHSQPKAHFKRAVAVYREEDDPKKPGEKRLVALGRASGYVSRSWYQVSDDGKKNQRIHATIVLLMLDPDPTWSKARKILFSLAAKIGMKHELDIGTALPVNELARIASTKGEAIFWNGTAVHTIMKP